MPQNRLSGERWNNFTDAGIKRWFDRRDQLMDAIMADGYPPFSEPRTERDQFMTLLAWKQAGDMRFVGNPQAQAEFQRLAGKYQTGPGYPLGAPTFPTGSAR